MSAETYPKTILTGDWHFLTVAGAPITPESLFAG